MTRVSGIVAPGSAPAAGFEAPFEMLHACHERVERMMNLLAKLREHVRTHSADVQARQAAADVMRYFDVAAPEHHRDEERHVFPALLALNDPNVTHLVARLQREHVLMDARWAASRALLSGVADGTRTAFDADDERTLDTFGALYAGHVEAEESVAYPRARSTMGETALQAMSRDMMARRGVRGPKA